MKRQIMAELLEWKESKERKPLILKGARQVGKTWIMKEFGKNYYTGYVYFNFDEEEGLRSIFEISKDPEKIIEQLGLLTGKKIEAGKTLILFDEIQECPDALNSLKYFNEKAKEYHIISAGSLLGTLLAQPKSFPVGQVDLLYVYPFNFEEYLEATDEILWNYYLTIEKGAVIADVFHQKLLEAYDRYLIIGGMPESVSSWIKYKDAEKVRTIQKNLVAIYENDFAKHNGKVRSSRILLVFRSIVSQLGKENEKFIYGCIKSGARAREFEEAIEWLVSAGMVNRIYNVSKPEHPLPVYDKLNHFKLFLFDTGLLKYMAGIDNKAILLHEKYQFKGPLAENYVLQQIRDLYDVEPRFYTQNNEWEIDFLLQKGTDIIPLEVKAGENVGAKSFKGYIEKNQPVCAVRFSRLPYRKDDKIVNIPLYLARKTKELLE